jgi:hypothetical protein
VTLLKSWNWDAAVVRLGEWQLAHPIELKRFCPLVTEAWEIEIPF